MATPSVTAIRAGSYGDPANVKYEIWDALYKHGLIDGTGYTQQWRTCDQRLARYLMASVDSRSEALEAQAMGWRTYEVDVDGLGPDSNTIICPEWKPKGAPSTGVTCSTCLLCDGNRKDAKNILIPPIASVKAIKTGAVACYVNTGWLTKMWLSWAVGNVPTVTADAVADYVLSGTGDMPSTVEIWRGPSPWDGSPIVLLVTGLQRPSQNTKTGPMVQTFILRQDMRPIEAVTTGADAATCGSCRFRPSLVKAEFAIA